MADINEKIDEMANGIDELKTNAEELADEQLSEKSREQVQKVHDALEDASVATDKLVNDEK